MACSRSMEYSMEASEGDIYRHDLMETEEELKEGSDEAQRLSESESYEHSQKDRNNPEENEALHLSDSIFIYTSKKMTSHGNVFEGEIRSGVCGVRPCAIKFARKNEDNAREAKILTKLSSHTHVVSIIQSGIHIDLFEEHVYIALDKCHKQNLGQYFEHRKESGLVYDVNIGLEYSKQIIAGMKYVHENLIFHKDLKPSNILLSHDQSTIKLADFGLSQELKSTSSKVLCTQQFGTNGFRPPESFGNSWASLKSDIFSLGVVFYFILSNAKSPFGDDFHLWTYNTKRGLSDVSHLLVPNSKTTEHLMKLMLSQERCRRPSISQVAAHPCWNGNKVECNFDYGCAEEEVDADIQVLESPRQESSDSETEIEKTLEFVKAIEKMGFKRSTTPETSIVIFDRNSRHLQRYYQTSNTITQMHKFNDEMKMHTFSSVSLGNHIYVLRDRVMHRISYRDATAQWERMPDLIDDHGSLPHAVAASGVIILAGGSYAESSFTKSATKYDPSLNRWEKLEDKQLATIESVNVASKKYVYSVGGLIGGTGPTDRVERFDLLSQKWNEVAPMKEARHDACGVECVGKLLVAGGMSRGYQSLSSVEMYDPNENQWTIAKPMSVGRWQFRCHLINGIIYAVGPYWDRGIERYDVDENEWEFVDLPDSVKLNIEGSVTINMQ